MRRVSVTLLVAVAVHVFAVLGLVAALASGWGGWRVLAGLAALVVASVVWVVVVRRFDEDARSPRPLLSAPEYPGLDGPLRRVS